MIFEVELALRLILAAALGAVIGFQREKVHKQAGLRTTMIICMGSATDFPPPLTHHGWRLPSCWGSASSAPV